MIFVHDLYVHDLSVDDVSVDDLSVDHISVDDLSEDDLSDLSDVCSHCSNNPFGANCSQSRLGDKPVKFEVTCSRKRDGYEKRATGPTKYSHRRAPDIRFKSASRGGTHLPSCSSAHSFVSWSAVAKNKNRRAPTLYGPQIRNNLTKKIGLRNHPP